MNEPGKIEFYVAGTQCVGYLYRPGAPSGQLPAIVMAHGFSGTQQGSLARTARDFADAGFLVLTFDYRSFGESAGAPRQVINIARQLADWAAAVAVVRGLDDVDPSRVALWGSSLSGAHVVHIAAEDHGIAAVVAQVPFNGFPAKVEGRSATASLALLWMGLKDRVREWLGLAPLYIPVVGRPGERAVIITLRADAIIAALNGSQWENRVAPRAILDMLGYRPGTVAHRVTAPLLVCAAELDVHTPPDLARLIAERAPRGEVRTYPCAHFDFYDDPLRATVATDQIEFLKKVLIAT